MSGSNKDLALYWADKAEKSASWDGTRALGIVGIIYAILHFSDVVGTASEFFADITRNRKQSE